MKMVRPLLRCVDCGGMLADMICMNCRRSYASIQGIPNLLSKQDEKSPVFQEYFQNYTTIANDDIEKDLMPVYYKEAQARKAISYCGNITGRVMDVGSGKGLILKRIPNCYRVAVDISVDYLKLISQDGIHPVIANAENLPFNNAFDVIFMTDILEHVFNPDKALDSVYRALKPNGKLLVRVPYQEDISVYKQSQYKYTHLRSFDKNSLSAMVKNSGLKPKAVYYDGFNLHKAKNRTFRAILCKASTYINIDNYIANLPNWIGNLAFMPLEISLLACKEAK